MNGMTYEEIRSGKIVRIRSMALERSTRRSMIRYSEVESEQEWVVEAAEFFREFVAHVETERDATPPDLVICPVVGGKIETTSILDGLRHTQPGGMREMVEEGPALGLDEEALRRAIEASAGVGSDTQPGHARTRDVPITRGLRSA